MLTQNTQDLRKKLDEINQQKSKLNKDEKNNTNNKNENVRLSNILITINQIDNFSEYKFLSDKQPTQLKTEPLPDEDRSNIKQPAQLKYLNLFKEISKPLGIKITRNDFISLIKDIANNLDDKDCQTAADKRNCDLKNAENFLLEITTKKFSKVEARKLYNDLIKPDVDALEQTKGKGKNERKNNLNIINNIESSIFEGVYLYYSDDKSELEKEESIAERTKLRRQRCDEICKREEKISLELFEKCFYYLSPNDMYQALNETKHLEENKAQVNTIECRLTNLIKKIKRTPKNDTKIKNRNYILEIVEPILYFNQQNQAG